MRDKAEVHILSLIFDSTVSMGYSDELRQCVSVCLCMFTHAFKTLHICTTMLVRVAVWTHFHSLRTAARFVRLHTICGCATVPQSQVWRLVCVTVTQQRSFCLSAVSKSIYQKSDLRWLERRSGLNMTDSQLLTNSQQMQAVTSPHSLFVKFLKQRLSDFLSLYNHVSHQQAAA